MSYLEFEEGNNNEDMRSVCSTQNFISTSSFPNVLHKCFKACYVTYFRVLPYPSKGAWGAWRNCCSKCWKAADLELEISECLKTLEGPYISFRTGIKAETDTDRQKARAELELALRVGADLPAPKKFSQGTVYLEGTINLCTVELRFEFHLSDQYYFLQVFENVKTTYWSSSLPRVWGLCQSHLKSL